MTDDMLIGRRVGGYAIEKLIGHGGMASVYKAHDRSGAAVALKVLRADAPTGDAADRLAREAAWLARCADPHIVRIFAVTRWMSAPTSMAPVRCSTRSAPDSRPFRSRVLRVSSTRF